MKYLFFIFTLLIGNSLYAAETCSRVAIINYQDVLVDTNSTQKGEGLRYHLDKDPKAKMYLDKYQEGTQIKWENAIMGTAGSGLLIGGLLSNSDTDKKRNLMASGAVLILINFLVARTLENSNEKNLFNAIEEYNKRNLPKIYFSPKDKNDQSFDSERTFSFLINKSWGF